jgi:hypothetical protein
MKDNVIWTAVDWRILECIDESYDFDDLCGDTFNSALNPEIPSDQMERELREFTDKVNNEGVYGYVLEQWNPAVGVGWEHQDSCWGFVGRHRDENHYIVAEMQRHAAIHGAPVGDRVIGSFEVQQ